MSLLRAFKSRLRGGPSSAISRIWIKKNLRLSNSPFDDPQVEIDEALMLTIRPELAWRIPTLHDTLAVAVAIVDGYAVVFLVTRSRCGRANWGATEPLLAVNLADPDSLDRLERGASQLFGLTVLPE